MDISSLEQIYTKFDYQSVTNLDELEKKWTKILGAEIHSLDDKTNMIILPYYSELLHRINNYQDKIPTDCRFFAMFMGNLILNKTNNISFTIPKKISIVDIMIPENCFYLTLDADYFVLKPTSDEKEPIYLNRIFESDQGQWIVKCKDDTYLGITDDGPIFLSLQKWKERYQSLVKKHMQNYKNGKELMRRSEDLNDILTHSYFRILSCKISKIGVKLAVYSFDIMGIPKNIDKKYISEKILIEK